MPRQSDRRCRGNDILPDDGCPIEERHLVAGVRFMAHVVMTYGEVYAPIFDRLERELAEFRRTESATERARKFLLA